MTIFQKSNVFRFPEEVSPRRVDVDESAENYLNHPTFGLLYSVCLLEDNQELFTTLYAMRLFFLVTTSTTSLKFEPIGRTDVRLMMDNRLRHLGRSGESKEYQKLQAMHQQLF